MNPFRWLVYGISWLYQVYKDIKYRASFEYIEVNNDFKRRYR